MNMNAKTEEEEKSWIKMELSPGSDVMYIQNFIAREEAQKLLKYLDQIIPWSKPTIVVFGRPCLQPRETCYIAKDGLPSYKYSGYEPPVYSWEDFPPLKYILNAVHEMLPGTTFNSLLLNRYRNGCDYVGWHADNESSYGPTPTIASVTLGAEREFLMRRKTKAKIFQSPSNNDISKEQQLGDMKPMSGNSKGHCSAICCGIKRTHKDLKMNKQNKQTKVFKDTHSFALKHGSLLVMRGYTQRDWEHSVPRRMKVPGLRINLTFRCILPSVKAQ